jgi:carbon-monoxide dehydrogenase medium subunit
MRIIRSDEFFLGPLTTALAPDEIIVEVRLPAWPPRRRWGFQEFSRRRGDFALAGVALFYDEDDDGKAANVHAGAIGVGDRPVRLSAAEAALNGRTIDAASIAAAAHAASAEVEPHDDIHAPAAYRKALVGTLTERALKAAAAL